MGMQQTYIKKKFTNVSVLIFSLEVDITERVDDENLAVLCDDPLACARWSRGGNSSFLRINLRGPDHLAGLLHGGLALLASGLLFVHSSFSAVPGHRGGLLLLLGGRGWRGRGGSFDIGNTKTSAPSSVSCKLDVAINKLLLALPAHVQDQVVHASADDEEQASQDRSQARAVPVVVVISALPQGEAVGEEVIISHATGPAENVGNETEARLFLTGLLDGSSNVGLGEWLAGLDARLFLGIAALGSLGSQLLLDLVGVKRTGLLAVRLGDFVLRGRGGNIEDVVKGRARVYFVSRNLVSNAEDFTI